MPCTVVTNGGSGTVAEYSSANTATPPTLGVTGEK